MNGPTFTVVIPVYNRAEALRDAIASVLQQTWQDFEIVVVDDGSSDDPRSVVDSFRDRRIRFERQANAGGGAARNRGIDLAQGRLVAFLDSDDVFLPHHLASMRARLDGRRNHAGYARMLVERGGGRVFVKPPRAIQQREHMATYLLCDRGFVPTITLVVERALAATVRYDETLPFAQDTDFAIRLFLAGCRFSMASEPGAIWRDHVDPNRASAGRKGARLASWLETMRPSIPRRAYYGARGWLIAKGVARESLPRALRLYAEALLHGAYGPRLAAVIFLQIFLADSFYRRLADTAIGLFGNGVWSRRERNGTLPSP
jgi:glycosyltransferase involved in cell wall biosynthesis